MFSNDQSFYNTIKLQFVASVGVAIQCDKLMSTTVLKDDKTGSHDEHANDEAAGHHQSVLVEPASSW